MILLIDNYDSFSYNLFQQAAAIEPDMRVVRNDALTVSEIEGLNPSHIILSPGPGYPKDAGICEEVVSRLGGSIPILGVCLGHQAICEAFGGRIEHAQQLMHGRGERRRVLRVHAGDDVMADEHGLCALVDAGLEGEQVARLERGQRPLIDRLTGVGVRRAAVAGEVLEHHADAVGFHLLHDRADKIARFRGISAKRTRIDKARGVARYVADGREVDVHAE